MGGSSLHHTLPLVYGPLRTAQWQSWLTVRCCSSVFPEGDEEGEEDQEQHLAAGDQDNPCEEKLAVANNCQHKFRLA